MSEFPRLLGVDSDSPKDMLRSKPHTCERDLIWEKGLADVVELRTCGIGFRGTPSNDSGPSRRKRDREEGRHPCDNGSRGWNDATTSQGMPDATKNWRKQEGPSPGATRGSTGLRHSDCGLLASRTVRDDIFVMSSYLLWGTCYSSPRRLVWIAAMAEGVGPGGISAPALPA